MRGAFVGLFVTAGLLGLAGDSAAQGACTRSDLQKAVDSYVAAQTKGRHR
jgi:hypothetical protein